MFQNFFISLAVIFSGVFANSQVLTATQILNQIHVEYNQRFDSNHQYINDPALTQKFKASQLNAIQILRQNKMIGQSFQVHNSAMTDLIITVSIVQELNQDFAGLLVERSKYATPDAESLLRLFNFPILNGGMDMFTMNGGSVINLKSQNLTAAAGGMINVKFPVDFNKGQFSQAQISLIRTVSGFKFAAPNGAAFSAMNLQVWYSIFSQDFGVSNVSFQ